MKRLLLILFVISSVVFTRGEISGVVKNHKGMVFKNATIQLLNVNSIVIYRTITGEDGSYKIKKIKNGNYTLVISSNNYKSYNKNITIDGGLIFKKDKKKYNVILKPISAPKTRKSKSSGVEILQKIAKITLALISTLLFYFIIKYIFSKAYKFIINQNLRNKLNIFIKRYYSSVKTLNKTLKKSRDDYLEKIKQQKLEWERLKKEKEIADYNEFGRDDIIARGKRNKERLFEKEVIIEEISDSDGSNTLELQSERLSWIFYIAQANVLIFFLWQDGYKNLFQPSDQTSNLFMYSPSILEGEFWRLLTPAFLHGDIIHLAFNMYALYNLSEICTLLYSKVRFLTSYLFFAFAGCFGSFLWLLDGRAYSLGASGAIFGIVGMLLGHYSNASDNSVIKAILAKNSLWQSVIVMFGYGFIVPGIDNAAHIGGFIAGYLVGALYMVSIDQPCEIDVT